MNESAPFVPTPPNIDSSNYFGVVVKGERALFTNWHLHHNPLRNIHLSKGEALNLAVWISVLTETSLPKMPSGVWSFSLVGDNYTSLVKPVGEKLLFERLPVCGFDCLTPIIRKSLAVAISVGIVSLLDPQLEVFNRLLRDIQVEPAQSFCA
jgi:hypothetical protein